MSIFAMLASLVYCTVGCNVGAPDLQSLHVLACDTETGETRLVQTLKGFQGTTYFQADAARRWLYSAIGETKGERTVGTLVRFPLEAGRLGSLERLAELPCETPCHISVTPDGAHVAFAAYGSATAGTLSLQTSELKTFVFPNDAMGPNAKRQKKAYAHQTFTYEVPGVGSRLGVVDLGCDRIWFFDPMTMAHDKALDLTTDPGDGPRHAISSKDGKFLFVVNELGSSVATFAFREKKWMNVGKWSMLPRTFNMWEPDGLTLASKAAAIKLTFDGKLLMASNRGYDSIAFYEVDERSGELRLRNIAPLNGKFPRDFELMPGEKFMIVGHKMSNQVQVYRFDRQACTLTAVGAPLDIWRPLCFKF